MFPQCVLDGGVLDVVWWCGDWVLSKASSLLCGCQSPVRGSVCSLVVGVEDPISVSGL